MSQDKQVVVVPCSGIGKAFGSVAREAGYVLCDELRPETTRLVALSKLVLGDEEAREWVRRCPAIAIDGCKLACAATLVQQSGGAVARQAAVLDAYRRHKELKPDGIAELNAQGKQLARVMARSSRRRSMSFARRLLEATMPRLPQRKVGIISCSGEEIAEGTVSRLAALKVLHETRPGQTVTICLPLFLAGGEGERTFAKFYPPSPSTGASSSARPTAPKPTRDSPRPASS